MRGRGIGTARGRATIMRANGAFPPNHYTLIFLIVINFTQLVVGVVFPPPVASGDESRPSHCKISVELLSVSVVSLFVASECYPNSFNLKPDE